MPTKTTVERAKKDKRGGKAPTTRAGGFVREEIEHVRRGKHGARSPKQAIAIGLSKARRAGVDLPPPKEGRTSEGTSERAMRDLAAGRRKTRRAPSGRRSKARRKVLKREPGGASHTSLSRQARQSAAARRRRHKVSA